jgi:hypothetical protein
VRFTRSALVAAIAVAASLGAAAVFAAPTDIGSGATATEQADRGESTQLDPAPQPSSATYVVTVNVEWGSATHPTTLPPNSHISPPVVVSHRTVGDLFSAGALASPGIEAMAELGQTSTLSNELLSNGSVTSVQVGASLFGPGRRQSTVLLSQPSGDLVSLVTMLAPSPDWFVGVADADLFTDGAWIDELTVDLGNYDAGTDSAPGFVHSNVDTHPAQPISGPRDAAFSAAVAEGRFGTVTFTRIP